MDDGGAVAVLLLWLLFGGVITGLVGSFIDGMRGFLWGFFLGPIGWIIAAILKGKNDQSAAKIYVEKSSGESFAVKGDTLKNVNSKEASYDRKKWEFLKEVDLEIRSASEEVSKLDKRLDDELGERYLSINQKEYLAKIVESLINGHKEKIARADKLKKGPDSALVDEAEQELLEYKSYIAEDGFDKYLNAKVRDVEVYLGAWVAWRGGIVIYLDDGRVVLSHRGMQRVFKAGDEGWR